MENELALLQAGSLREHPLAEILLAARRICATGTLRLTIAGLTSRLFLRDGAPSGARMAWGFKPLGQVLLENALVDHHFLSAALPRVAQGEELPAILRELGALTDDALAEGLRLQLRAHLRALAACDHGIYSFALDDEAPPVGPHALSPELAIADALSAPPARNLVLGLLDDLGPNLIQIPRDRLELLSTLELLPSERTALVTMVEAIAPEELVERGPMPSERAWFLGALLLALEIAERISPPVDLLDDGRRRLARYIAERLAALHSGAEPPPSLPGEVEVALEDEQRRQESLNAFLTSARERAEREEHALVEARASFEAATERLTARRAELGEMRVRAAEDARALVASARERAEAWLERTAAESSDEAEALARAVLTEARQRSEALLAELDAENARCQRAQEELEALHLQTRRAGQAFSEEEARAAIELAALNANAMKEASALAERITAEGRSAIESDSAQIAAFARAESEEEAREAQSVSSALADARRRREAAEREAFEAERRASLEQSGRESAHPSPMALPRLSTQRPLFPLVFEEAMPTERRDEEGVESAQLADLVAGTFSAQEMGTPEALITDLVAHPPEELPTPTSVHETAPEATFEEPIPEGGAEVQLDAADELFPHELETPPETLQLTPEVPEVLEEAPETSVEAPAPELLPVFEAEESDFDAPVATEQIAISAASEELAPVPAPPAVEEAEPEASHSEDAPLPTELISAVELLAAGPIGAQAPATREEEPAEADEADLVPAEPVEATDPGSEIPRAAETALPLAEPCDEVEATQIEPVAIAATKAAVEEIDLDLGSISIPAWKAPSPPLPAQPSAVQEAQRVPPPLPRALPRMASIQSQEEEFEALPVDAEEFSKILAATPRTPPPIPPLPTRRAEPSEEPASVESASEASSGDEREPESATPTAEERELERLIESATQALKQRAHLRASELFAQAFSLGNRPLHLAQSAWALYLEPGDKAQTMRVRSQLDHALQLDPACDRAAYWLGVIARVDGDMERAESFFKRALEANSANAEARTELRLLKMRQGKARGMTGSKE